jgi:hypothetical protein
MKDINRLHFWGKQFLGDSSIEDSSAETDLFYGEFLERERASLVSGRIFSGIMSTE